MKNDELLQAAELIAGWEPFAWKEIGVTPIDKQVLNKLIFVARAHVAEHSADDGQLLTEAWLISAGFVKRGLYALARTIETATCTFVLSCADYENLPCCWEMWNEFDDNTEPEGSCLPCQPKTRGEVRRLCEALGIELRA